MRSMIEMLSQGNYVSGEAMSRELGVSRAAVWKKITSLKEQGWDIEAGGSEAIVCMPATDWNPSFGRGSLKRPSWDAVKFAMSRRCLPPTRC